MQQNKGADGNSAVFSDAMHENKENCGIGNTTDTINDTHEQFNCRHKMSNYGYECRISGKTELTIPVPLSNGGITVHDHPNVNTKNNTIENKWYRLSINANKYIEYDWQNQVLIQMLCQQIKSNKNLNSKKYRSRLISIFRVDINNEWKRYTETVKMQYSHDGNRVCIDAFHIGKYGTQRMVYATPDINGKLFNAYDCCMDKQPANPSSTPVETMPSQPGT